MNKKQSSIESDALITATGLIWGWLEQGDVEQALKLVQACVVCWPKQPLMHLLHRQCLVTLNMPLTTDFQASMQYTPQAWRSLIEKLEARQVMYMDANNGAPAQA